MYICAIFPRLLALPSLPSHNNEFWSKFSLNTKTTQVSVVERERLYGYRAQSYVTRKGDKGIDISAKYHNLNGYADTVECSAAWAASKSHTFQLQYSNPTLVPVRLYTTHTLKSARISRFQRYPTHMCVLGNFVKFSKLSNLCRIWCLTHTGSHD